MKPVMLTVNGEHIEALVEPRTHLADFLREQCRLTGTHLGCEHGVCGACTVLIDGQPARSCIAFAMQCDGQAIRTIEGFEDDPLMTDLRAAFTREHALQCGFCTPGMLIASRDIVERCPDADERRVRTELSGNLCRCTGYLGIVNAVKSVIDARSTAGGRPIAAANAPLAREPVRAWTAFAPEQSPGPAIEVGASGATAAAPPHSAPDPIITPGNAPAIGLADGYQRLETEFVAHHPSATVWAAFADVAEVASCLPGATIQEAGQDSAKGQITVKFGPMSASFQGAAALERDDANMTGRLRGAGSDRLTQSRARADIAYRLRPESGGEHTRVAITMDYNLQGPLAQFSRSGIVKEFVDRMVAQFAENLNARLGSPGSAAARAALPPAKLDAGSMFWQILWQRIRRWFRG